MRTGKGLSSSEGGMPYWSGGLDFNGCLVLYYNACVHVPFMCMRLVVTDVVFSVYSVSCYPCNHHAPYLDTIIVMHVPYTYTYSVLPSPN